jgi:hypothetical protein
VDTSVDRNLLLSRHEFGSDYRSKRYEITIAKSAVKIIGVGVGSAEIFRPYTPDSICNLRSVSELKKSGFFCLITGGKCIFIKDN